MADAHEPRRLWVVTHNLTGYMPESAPFWTDDRDMAYAVLLDELGARVDWHAQIPDEYRTDDDGAAEDDAAALMGDAMTARGRGDDEWMGGTDHAPYTTFTLESYGFENLAAWLDYIGANDDPDIAECQTWADALQMVGGMSW